jgi:hypothetical protein
VPQLRARLSTELDRHGPFMQQLKRDDVEPLLTQRANEVLDRLKAAVIENYATVQRQDGWGQADLPFSFPPTRRPMRTIPTAPLTLPATAHSLSSS